MLRTYLCGEGGEERVLSRRGGNGGGRRSTPTPEIPQGRYLVHVELP